MVTRNDVARQAGVSTAVVSYVINNSNYVSPETRARVLKAVEELKYTPNSTARSLKTSKSKHLALVGNDLRNSFFSELGHHMGQRAYQKGFIVSILDMVEKSDYINTLLSHQLAGLCIASDLFYDDQLNSIAERVPLVLIANRHYEDLHDRITQVIIESYPVVKKAIHFFYNSGKTNIAYLSSPPMDDIHRTNYRYLAYRDALAEIHDGIDKEILVDNLRDRRLELPMIVESLTVNRGVNGFFCTNDEIAIQVTKILQDLKIKVPDEVGVCGSDDLHFTRYFSPGISSIAFSKEDLGRLVVDLLTHDKDNAPPSQMKIPAKLILRESM